LEDLLLKSLLAPKTLKARRKKAPLKTPKRLDVPDLLRAPSKPLLIPPFILATKKTIRRRAIKRVKDMAKEIYEPLATISQRGRMSKRALFYDEFVANQTANQKKK
jgi:hypothetical protein